MTGDVGGEEVVAAAAAKVLVRCDNKGGPSNALVVAWEESHTGYTNVFKRVPIKVNTSSIISESITLRSMLAVLFVISKKITEASVAI